LVTGGEDDLITIYSFHENRVICRGRGHRSWVTSISFDPYTTSAIDNSTFEDVSDEESPGEILLEFYSCCVYYIILCEMYIILYCVRCILYYIV